VAKELGAVWNVMSAEDKAPFIAMADASKAQANKRMAKYLKELQAYENEFGHPDDANFSYDAGSGLVGANEGSVDKNGRRRLVNKVVVLRPKTGERYRERFLSQQQQQQQRPHIASSKHHSPHHHKNKNKKEKPKPDSIVHNKKQQPLTSPKQNALGLTPVQVGERRKSTPKSDSKLKSKSGTSAAAAAAADAAAEQPPHELYFVLTYIPDLQWCRLAPMERQGVFESGKYAGREKWKLVPEERAQEVDGSAARCDIVKDALAVKKVTDADREEWVVLNDAFLQSNHVQVKKQHSSPSSNTSSTCGRSTTGKKRKKRALGSTSTSASPSNAALAANGNSATSPLAPAALWGRSAENVVSPKATIPMQQQQQQQQQQQSGVQPNAAGSKSGVPASSDGGGGGSGVPVLAQMAAAASGLQQSVASASTAMALAIGAAVRGTTGTGTAEQQANEPDGGGDRNSAEQQPVSMVAVGALANDGTHTQSTGESRPATDQSIDAEVGAVTAPTTTTTEPVLPVAAKAVTTNDDVDMQDNASSANNDNSNDIGKFKMQPNDDKGSPPPVDLKRKRRSATATATGTAPATGTTAVAPPVTVGSPKLTSEAQKPLSAATLESGDMRRNTPSTPPPRSPSSSDNVGVPPRRSSSRKARPPDTFA
jgi:hypothetical protein